MRETHKLACGVAQLDKSLLLRFALPLCCAGSNKHQVDALEVFGSSNVANVLIESLGRLLQMGEGMQLSAASVDHITAVSNGKHKRYDFKFLLTVRSHHCFDRCR